MGDSLCNVSPPIFAGDPSSRSGKTKKRRREKEKRRGKAEEGGGKAEAGGREGERETERGGTEEVSLICVYECILVVDGNSFYSIFIG